MSERNNNNDALSPGISTTTIKPVEIPGLIWFYGMWVSLAMTSAVIGHSRIDTDSALFLLGGITSTNFVFLMIAHTEQHTAVLARLLAGYQAIMAIAWISAYYYFSHGAGDLVLGMYMTAVMFGVFNLNTRALLILTISALLSYLTVLGIKFVTLPASVMLQEEILRFLVLAIITGWLYLFAGRLRNLHFELQSRNDQLQNVVTRVTRIAEEDHLTKSHNRRYIMDVLARERSRSDRFGNIFSVLLFDLDHFKNINDRYGHLIGDQILSDFAQRVKYELRGMDTVNNTDHKRSFGRYGGEEFIAVLPGTNLKGGEQCAERIRKVIGEQEFRGRYSITVSVGVAEYLPGETIPQLLTRTDQALYRAKRDGRNLVRCSDQAVDRQPETRPNLRILK
jgi:diguanylate cyclase